MRQEAILRRNQTLSRNLDKQSARRRSGLSGSEVAHPGQSTIIQNGKEIPRSGGVGSVQRHGVSRRENTAIDVAQGAFVYKLLDRSARIGRGNFFSNAAFTKSIFKGFADDFVGPMQPHIRLKNSFLSRNIFLTALADSIHKTTGGLPSKPGLFKARVGEDVAKSLYLNRQKLILGQLGTAKGGLRGPRAYMSFMARSKALRDVGFRIKTLGSVTKKKWEIIPQNIKKILGTNFALTAIDNPEVLNTVLVQNLLQPKVFRGGFGRRLLAKDILFLEKKVGIQRSLLKQVIPAENLPIGREAAKLGKGFSTFAENAAFGIGASGMLSAKSGIKILKSKGIGSLAKNLLKTSGLRFMSGIGAASPVLTFFWLAKKNFQETQKLVDEAVMTNNKSTANLSSIFQGQMAQHYRTFGSSITRSGYQSGWGAINPFNKNPLPASGQVVQSKALYNLNQMGFHQAFTASKTTFGGAVRDWAQWGSVRPFLDRMKGMAKLKERFEKSISGVLGAGSLGTDAINDAYGGRISTNRNTLITDSSGVKSVTPLVLSNINHVLESADTAPQIVQIVDMANQTISLVKKREEEQKMWDSLPENYEPIKRKHDLAQARETLMIHRIQQWNKQ